jgi:hypothetical protein
VIRIVKQRLLIHVQHFENHGMMGYMGAGSVSGLDVVKEPKTILNIDIKIT